MLDRKRRALSEFALISVAVLSGCIAGMAIADNYGDYAGSAGWKPDGSNHTYCFGPDFEGTSPRTAAGNKMDNLEDQTTMTKQKLSGCSDATDAKFGLANLGLADGEYDCLFLSGVHCTRATLRFDESNVNSFDDWSQTTCHEIGHSVGLAHGNEEDCMGTNHSQPNDRHYNDHHVSHINTDRF